MNNNTLQVVCHLHISREEWPGKLECTNEIKNREVKYSYSLKVFLFLSFNIVHFYASKLQCASKVTSVWLKRITEAMVRANPGELTGGVRKSNKYCVICSGYYSSFGN